MLSCLCGHNEHNFYFDSILREREAGWSPSEHRPRAGCQCARFAKKE